MYNIHMGVLFGPYNRYPGRLFSVRFVFLNAVN